MADAVALGKYEGAGDVDASQSEADGSQQADGPPAAKKGRKKGSKARAPAQLASSAAGKEKGRGPKTFSSKNKDAGLTFEGAKMET